MKAARALYVCAGAAIGWAGCQASWVAWAWLATTAGALYLLGVAAERRP